MSPQLTEGSSGLDERVRWRTVGALAITVTGLIAIFLGFLVYQPFVVLSMVLAGVGLGVGGAYLKRLRETPDTDRPRATESTTETTAQAKSGQEPIDILKTRYARGDVGDEEFEHRIDRLLAVDLEDGQSEQRLDLDTERSTR